jgi:hypothetical protein
MDDDQAGEEPQQPPLGQIIIQPEQMAGVWANFARVGHSLYEFTLDFVRLDFGEQPPTGIVVARVSVSPLFVTQLIEALNLNWEQYAAKAMPKEIQGGQEPEG